MTVFETASSQRVKIDEPSVMSELGEFNPRADCVEPAHKICVGGKNRRVKIGDGGERRKKREIGEGGPFSNQKSSFLKTTVDHLNGWNEGFFALVALCSNKLHADWRNVARGKGLIVQNLCLSCQIKLNEGLSGCGSNQMCPNRGKAHFAHV